MVSAACGAFQSRGAFQRGSTSHRRRVIMKGSYGSANPDDRPHPFGAKAAAWRGLGMSGGQGVAQSPRTTHFSFGQQELAHFPNDQRFVYDEHVVVRITEFDHSRVLHFRAETLDRASYPLRE